MGSMGTLEAIVLGAMVILIVIWFRPGIKASLERGRDAPKDWAGVLIPIALVVLFVIFLITLVS